MDRRSESTSSNHRTDTFLCLGLQDIISGNPRPSPLFFFAQNRGKGNLAKNTLEIWPKNTNNFRTPSAARCAQNTEEGGGGGGGGIPLITHYLLFKILICYLKTGPVVLHEDITCRKGRERQFSYEITRPAIYQNAQLLLMSGNCIIWW